MVTSDSDFFVYDIAGCIPLKSIVSHSLSRTVTFDLYKRERLLASLTLGSDKVALLATLMGNDMISSERLRPFYSQFSSERFDIRDIAEFLRSPSTADAFSAVTRCFSDAQFVETLRVSVESYEHPTRASDTEHLFTFLHAAHHEQMQRRYSFVVALIALM